MTKDTRTDLVDTLEQEALTSEPVRMGSILEIIERARLGTYHDYKSTLPMPKSALVQDLRAVGLDALAGQVAAGEYDEAPDAEDRATLSEVS